MNDENRVGDRGSPWRTPEPTLNHDEQESFTRTHGKLDRIIHLSTNTVPQKAVK